jgi:hypothetical protein
MASGGAALEAQQAKAGRINDQNEDRLIPNNVYGIMKYIHSLIAVIGIIFCVLKSMWSVVGTLQE